MSKQRPAVVHNKTNPNIFADSSSDDSSSDSSDDDDDSSSDISVTSTDNEAHKNKAKKDEPTFIVTLVIFIFCPQKLGL